MKKGFEKFLAISTGAINLFFLVLIGLIIFKRIDVGLFDNELVITLLSVLGCINIVLIGFIITNSFIDREALNAIMLFSDKTSSTRASMSVVKKIVRRSAKQLGNVKVGKIALFLEENSGLRMRIAIKVREDQVEDAVDKFRCLLIDEFKGILEVEFNSIDFKINTLKTNYKADMTRIDQAAKKLKEERAAKQAREKERLMAIEEENEKADEIIEEEVENLEGTLNENVDPAFEEGTADIVEDADDTLQENLDADFAEELKKEEDKEATEEVIAEEIEDNENKADAVKEKDTPEEIK